MSKTNYSVAVLAGDGIGPEVMAAAASPNAKAPEVMASAAVETLRVLIVPADSTLPVPNAMVESSPTVTVRLVNAPSVSNERVPSVIEPRSLVDNA